MKRVNLVGTNGKPVTLLSPSRADVTRLTWLPSTAAFPVFFSADPADQTTSPVKGGQGSGNFGHAGIPGHQGGSAPSGHLRPYKEGTTLSPTAVPVYAHDLDTLPVTKDTVNDPLLASITEYQGFDGLPAVVDHTTFDRLLASGEITVDLYRGVDDSPDMPAAQMLEQFKHGPFFIGKGSLGNGTYATKDRAVALEYGGGKPANVVRLGLRKGAKVVDLAQLSKETNAILADSRNGIRQMVYQARINKALQQQDTKTVLRLSQELAQLNATDPGVKLAKRITDNIGRAGAYLGYDAIRLKDIYVILNRTALYVEDQA